MTGVGGTFLYFRENIFIFEETFFRENLFVKGGRYLVAVAPSYYTFRTAESVTAPSGARRCSPHKSGLNSVYLKSALKMAVIFALAKNKACHKSS